MPKGTLFALLFLVAVTPLHARLGETEKQLIERFGKVVQRRPESIPAQGKMHEIGERLIFTKDDWRVNVVMIASSCEYIRYEHPGEWTEAQFSSLLTSNAGRYAWREDPKSRKLQRLWIRDDGTTATWGPYPGFVITSRKHTDTVESVKVAAKAKASQVPKF